MDDIAVIALVAVHHRSSRNVMKKQERIWVLRVRNNVIKNAKRFDHIALKGTDPLS